MKQLKKDFKFNIMRKLSMIGIAVCMVFSIFTFPSVTLSAVENSDLVTVSKKAEAVTGQENKFKVSLDINTGFIDDSVEEIGNDIVIVIDTSGSMGNSGIPAAKNAAKKLLENNELANNSKNTFSIVSFATKGKTWLNKGTATEAISILDRKQSVGNQMFPVIGNGGTFLQDGLKRARDILTGSENGYIVLLSDGKPTYSYNLNYDTRTLGLYPSKYGRTGEAEIALGYTEDYYLNENAFSNEIKGNGSSVYEYGNSGYVRMYSNEITNSPYESIRMDGYTSAKSEALLSKKAGHKIYSIAYETNDSQIDFLEQIATPGDEYYYKTSDNLDDAFDNIANSIATSYNTIINDGIVSDPMSKYVNLLDLADGIYQNSIEGRVVFTPGTSITVSTVEGKKQIQWNVGNVGKNANVHLEYYVSLKEEYHDGTSYPANDPTFLKYKDYADKDATKEFVVPEIKQKIKTDGLVTLNKTSTKEDYNKFRIDLSAKTGVVETTTTSSADIVFVVDTSGSMDWDVNGKSFGVAEKDRRITLAKKAINEFLSNDKIANGNNKFAVVTFATDATIEQPLADAVTTKETVNNLSADGGTNVQMGIRKAEEVLATSTDKSREKIIILLSDGEANRHRLVKTDLVGNNGRNLGEHLTSTTAEDKALGYTTLSTKISGDAINYSGNSTENEKTYYKSDKNSISFVANSTNLALNESLIAKQAGYEMFTIAYAMGTSASATNARNALKEMASPEEGHAYSSNDDLNPIFDKIAQTITERATIIRNGIVSDPMSEYVNLLGLENGTYNESIKGVLEFTQGSVTITSDQTTGKQKINWDIGNVGSEKEVKLSYYVELKDQYIDGNNYPANDPTTLIFTDVNSDSTEMSFPIPNVAEEGKPKLTISKNVIDGHDADANKEFTVHVEGKDIETNDTVYKIDVLVKNGESVALENLPFAEYTITESVPMEYKGTIKYGIKDAEGKINFTEGYVVTLKPGNSEGYIAIDNTFEHQGYFRDDAEVTNTISANDMIIHNYKYDFEGNVKEETSDVPQDIVLVLDVSGSMKDNKIGNKTRLDILKENVNMFLTTLHEKSPNSRISIVTYAENRNSLTNNGMIKLSDKITVKEEASLDSERKEISYYDYLVKGYTVGNTISSGKINELSASGGTASDLGLYAARKAFGDKFVNPRSVIFFTDGEPGRSGFDIQGSYGYFGNGYRVGAEAMNQADFLKGDFNQNITANNSIKISKDSYYGHKDDDVTTNRSSNNSNNQGNRPNRIQPGSGATVYSIAINNGPDNEKFATFLKAVASSHDKYIKGTDENSIKEAFENVFESITTIDTNVDIRINYDGTKFSPTNVQGGTKVEKGKNSYIEWKNIIGEDGSFSVKGLEFENIVVSNDRPVLTLVAYDKEGHVIELKNAEIKVVE